MPPPTWVEAPSVRMGMHPEQPRRMIVWQRVSVLQLSEHRGAMRRHRGREIPRGRGLQRCARGRTVRGDENVIALGRARVRGGSRRHEHAVRVQIGERHFRVFL